MTLLRELIDIPEHVRKGDFVLNLSKGVSEPEKTLDEYVVTPQLLACFDDALGFIRSAVDARNSKACYLHGSFGAGKSHFMAVLHLILQHNPAVRSRDDLAKVCADHGWVEDKNFLLVPYHMIGSRNMESAILGGYVDYVLERHSDAPLPGVYLADEIFKNAVQYRQRLGDEKFFEDLNRGQQATGGSGWGKLATGWDAARFEVRALVDAADPAPRALVLDLGAQDTLDLTSANVLIAMGREMRGRGIDAYLVDVHAPALAFARSVGVLDVIPAEHVFPTIELAVQHIEGGR